MAQKYISNFEDMSKLSQFIVKAHPNGYVGGLIEGPRGIGKSTFCLHIMREVYQYIGGLSRDDAWEIALDRILFTMNDIIRLLSVVEQIDMDNVIESQNELMIPVATWDDAGMHGGRLKHFIDIKATDKLNSVMDTARDALSGFLINAPEKEGLLSFIRRYKDNYWIIINYPETRGDKYKRIATVRKYYTDHAGRRRTRKIFTTKFSCYVEKWVYAEYKRKKLTAVRDELRHLEKIAKGKEIEATQKLKKLYKRRLEEDIKSS